MSTPAPVPRRISSRDNPRFKALRQLASDNTAYRRLGQVWLEGEHLLQAGIEIRLGTPALQLVADPATRAKVERAKNELLENPAVGEWWQQVWERIRTGLITAARDPDSRSSL